MKYRYARAEVEITYDELEDIVCGSLTDGGIGGEDDYGGEVGGGGEGEW